MEELRRRRGFRLVLRAIAIVLLLLSACSPAEPATPTATSTNAETTPTPRREQVVVPLSLHVMVEAGAPTSELSSSRTTDELRVISEAMADIWAQADLVFDPVNIHVLEVPPLVLQGVVLGNTDPFFDQVNLTFVPEDSQAVNGFYVSAAFGVNGFTPQGSNVFFVVDEPSVRDERVSSHEVGHIFGLHHDQQNPGQLMFSGTNGTGLSELEQTVARYGAQGLFPQNIEP